MKIAIILNGAPMSGKDVIGRRLKQLMKGTVRRFKEALIGDTASYYHVDKAFIREMIEVRKGKELPRRRLGGLSVREALIHVSENIIKPKYGNDYYGKHLAKQLTDGVNIITDSGFVEELRPVVAKADVTVVIRLHRGGCTFAKDSRRHLYAEDCRLRESELEDVTFIDVYNNKTLSEAVSGIHSELKRILGGAKIKAENS